MIGDLDIRELSAGLSDQMLTPQHLRRFGALFEKWFHRFSIGQAAREIGALGFIESVFQPVLLFLQLYLRMP